MIYSYHYRNSAARRAAFWMDALGLFGTVSMTVLLYILAACFLTGCSSVPKVDQYNELTIVRMDRAQMQKICSQDGGTTDRGGPLHPERIEGCYNRPTKTIYLDWAGRAIYHELAHFFCGDDADCNIDADKHDDPAPVYYTQSDKQRGIL